MAEHQSWQRVTPPGQRAHPPPFPFPPFLQSHPSSFHPFWDVARVLLQSASGTPASSSSEGQGGDVGRTQLHPQTLLRAGGLFEALTRRGKGLWRPAALRTSVRARPSRGSLQTQLFQNWGTAGSKAARATPSGGGRKGPAGGGGSQTKTWTPAGDNPPPAAATPGWKRTPPRHQNLPELREPPPHPAGRTHPPSGRLTGKGRVPTWTAFAGQTMRSRLPWHYEF